LVAVEKQTHLLHKIKEKVKRPEGVPRLFDLAHPMATGSLLGEWARSPRVLHRAVVAAALKEKVKTTEGVPRLFDLAHLGVDIERARLVLARLVRAR
jgi:structural maintenance of chromosome 4